MPTLWYTFPYNCFKDEGNQFNPNRIHQRPMPAMSSPVDEVRLHSHVLDYIASIGARAQATASKLDSGWYGRATASDFGCSHSWYDSQGSGQGSERGAILEASVDIFEWLFDPLLDLDCGHHVVCLRYCWRENDSVQDWIHAVVPRLYHHVPCEYWFSGYLYLEEKPLFEIS